MTPSTRELGATVRRQRWAAQAPVRQTPAERAAAARAADSARQADLYGDAVDDVRLLRRRGFVVVREGERYRVGNNLCSLGALRAKAARERRLLEAETPAPRASNATGQVGGARPLAVTRSLGEGGGIGCVAISCVGATSRPWNFLRQGPTKP